MLYFKVVGNKVCWVTIHDRVLGELKAPRDGINQKLLEEAKAHPEMKVGDFIRQYLGSVKSLTRITRSLEEVRGLNPEMLCLTDPAEWASIINNFGKKCADSLRKAIDEYCGMG